MINPTVLIGSTPGDYSMRDNTAGEDVLIIHNVVSPYRLPLFEELSNNHNLEVYFCKRDADNRKWDTSLEEYSFNYTILPQFSIGPLFVNFTLPIELLRNDYDIYIAGDTPNTLFALIVLFIFSRLTGTPLVFWSGWIDTDYSSRIHHDGIIMRVLVLAFRSVMEVFRKLTYPLVDGFISYSEKTDEFLIRRGANPENIYTGGQITPQSLLPDVKNPELEFDADTVVLTVCYLIERKGLEDLITAWKRINTETAVLIIAGSGPAEDRLKEMARDEDNIRFVGYVEGRRKARYYTLADLFVLPTLHDPMPQVRNEALYYELPIITTSAAGGMSVVIDNEAGIVVDPKAPTQLAEALEKLIEDDALREQYATNTQNIKDIFSTESGTRPFDDVISDLT